MHKALLRIILLTLCLYSCSDVIEDQKVFKYDTEVIAVFTPNGIGSQPNAALMYKGMVTATDNLGISLRAIVPATYQEGAETIAKLVSGNEKGRKRLIISTDPEYSDYLRNVAYEGKIVDSDSTKLLVLDGNLTHDDIYTAYVPFYGMMYKAGYVASRMHNVENIKMFIANDKYRYIRESIDGFIDGFNLNKEGYFDIYDFSMYNDDNTEGFLKGTFAYASYAPECYGLYDMVLPLCGETSLGFLRYNREFPGRFYTVGVETDMSVYASDVPFSCVDHLDRVLVSCITDWSEDRLARHKTFGMDEGWVELVISENYRSMLQAASDEIHAKAIEMEGKYER